MPTDSEMRSRRDSWPPTQMRLKPAISTQKSPLPPLDDIDDDPLTYFLTPAPDIDDDDMDMDMMDFGAGIQDDNQPREIIRTVSPSTLDGLRKPGLRPVSPDTSSDITADDDDDEDYIRFSPTRDSLLSLHDVFGDGTRPKSPAFGQSSNTTHLSPSSPQLRGRTRGHGPSRIVSSRRRLGQVWREPSPDVWSIEEETEEELMSDMGSSVAARSDIGDGEDERKTTRGKKAGKPKKKVRFMLPAQSQ
ncbi:hypothetical protein G7Z17_g7194 [Cylindrodendrum hubeiense]|uniref:Uncharacterized protein n=1 Tax=Cylindrodendrum hubeiense TaxID=595255 RepID=A0A9P5L7L0_9HYPO|nr:hypothetical protein G7Z17_g7194 [Cylindrodendrum hubeiense]